MEEGSSRLQEICSTGHMKTLMELWREKPDSEKARLANSILADGSTPLIIAVQHGNIALMLYLVEMCGADVDQKADSKTLTLPIESVKQAPPLWFAAREGQLDAVKYLARKSTDINTGSFNQSSPLRAACFAGHPEIVRYLLRFRADVNLPDITGSTPLHAACYRGHLTIVHDLMNNPMVDKNKLDNHGYCAVFTATSKGHIEIVKILLEKGAQQVPTEAACPPLFTAVNTGQLDMVKLLIENSQHQEWNVNGVGVMPDEGIRLTPVLRAAATGQEEIVCYMIDPNNFQHCGYKLNDREIVEALQLLGAAVISTTSYEEGRKKALQYWNAAINICHTVPDLHSQPSNQSIVEEILDTSEMKTVDEIKSISAEEITMRTQVALYFDRIVGPANAKGCKHPQAGVKLFNLGNMLVGKMEFCSTFRLLMKGARFLVETLLPCHTILAELFHSFARIFMDSIKNDTARLRPVKLCHVMMVMKELLIVLQKSQALLRNQVQLQTYSDEWLARSTNNHECMVLTLVQLISIACSTLISSDSVCCELRELTDRAVQLDLRGSGGQTLLQIASSPTSSASQFKHPNQPVIEFPCKCAIVLLKSHSTSKQIVQESGATNMHSISFNQKDFKQGTQPIEGNDLKEINSYS